MSCEPPIISPLNDKDQVKVHGLILTADGSPWDTGQITVATRSDPTIAQTDNRGHYSLTLLGFETKNPEGQAVDIRFTALHPDEGTLSYTSKVLEKNFQVPTLQFWDGPLSPLSDAIVSQDVEFFWEDPVLPLSSFELNLAKISSTKEDKIGSITISNTDTSFRLDKEIFENNTEYSWSMVAKYKDFSATSKTIKFKTSPTLNKHLEIQSATADDEDLPEIYDGTHDDFPGSKVSAGEEPKALIVDLGQSERISGIYLKIWGGFTEFAKVYISNSKTDFGPSLKTINTSDYEEGLSWLDLTDKNGRYLILEAQSGDSLRIEELRVIGG